MKERWVDFYLSNYRTLLWFGVEFNEMESVEEALRIKQIRRKLFGKICVEIDDSYYEEIRSKISAENLKNIFLQYPDLESRFYYYLLKAYKRLYWLKLKDKAQVNLQAYGYVFLLWSVFKKRLNGIKEFTEKDFSGLSNEVRKIASEYNLNSNNVHCYYDPSLNGETVETGYYYNLMLKRKIVLIFSREIILLWTQNKDEAKAIIFHEMAHIVHRDSISIIRRKIEKLKQRRKIYFWVILGIILFYVLYILYHQNRLGFFLMLENQFKIVLKLIIPFLMTFYYYDKIFNSPQINHFLEGVADLAAVVKSKSIALLQLFENRCSDRNRSTEKMTELHPSIYQRKENLIRIMAMALLCCLKEYNEKRGNG